MNEGTLPSVIAERYGCASVEEPRTRASFCSRHSALTVSSPARSSSSDSFQVPSMGVSFPAEAGFKPRPRCAHPVHQGTATPRGRPPRLLFPRNGRREDPKDREGHRPAFWATVMSDGGARSDRLHKLPGGTRSEYVGPEDVLIMWQRTHGALEDLPALFLSHPALSAICVYSRREIATALPHHRRLDKLVAALHTTCHCAGERGRTEERSTPNG